SLFGWLMRGALMLVLVACAALFVAHITWKYSGSNKWELVIDRNGVKVYSLKTPGDVLKKFKMVRRVHTSMRQIVDVMSDTSLQHCTDWNPSCVAAQIIEPWQKDAKSVHSLNYYRLNLPSPFSPRDLVFREDISQDPQSKVLTVHLVTVPDRFPDNNCCVHVTHIDNEWRWTPVGNGQVELVLTDELDPRLPYFMTNARAEQLYKLISHVPTLLSIQRKQYDYSKLFDFIQEPTN
ncbi:MAG: START domain-containing protein, partial [Terracidiphilus sp.]